MALVLVLLNGHGPHAYRVAGMLLALPAAACGIAGNWVGAGLGIRKGAGLIRRVLLAVLALLLAKMVLDVL